MTEPTPQKKAAKGFTLVELLVVIGIIGILMSILLPSLSKAQAYARKVQCMSNMRQVYAELQMYANSNRGWLFPMRDKAPWTYGYVGPTQYDASGNVVSGTDPKQVWTTMVFGRCDPPIMMCPIDNGAFPEVDDSGQAILPIFWHSYVINFHLADYKVKATAQGSQLAWKSQSEVILMGEKNRDKQDYFMEQAKKPDGTPDPTAQSDYSRLVDQFKHGLQLGSNYLYMDGHVDNDTKEAALHSLDPWFFAAPTTPTTP